MPHWVTFAIVTSSIVTADAVITRMPLRPVATPPGPTPLMSRPFKTTAPVPALTVTPVTLDDRMPPITPLQMMLIDLVMVTAPKPPESRQLISPRAAVFEIAPAKVLQGAVRLHGLASSPTPETQVRVAWAWAGEAGR